MGRETGLPTSSSGFSSSVMGRLTPSCASARMAASAMATPDFISSTPGPKKRPSRLRQGMVRSVPRGQTVSRWPSSRMGLRGLRAGPKRSSRTSPKCFCRCSLTRPPMDLREAGNEAHGLIDGGLVVAGRLDQDEIAQGGCEPGRLGVYGCEDGFRSFMECMDGTAEESRQKKMRGPFTPFRMTNRDRRQESDTPNGNSM